MTLSQEKRLHNASRLMMAFAGETGLLDDDTPPRRYLWTDAFAVCNFFGLARQTGKRQYRELALRLIEQVHQVLGRHHPDSGKSGWISGLDDSEAARHPTIGGLRIGKKMNERAPDDPYDEQLEWDRDGQYFHYLTKWMHALHVAHDETGNGDFHRWAVELARTALAAFSYEVRPGQPRRMYWKMRIDLSAPLVPSMGQHDPLDGFLTFLTLERTTAKIGDKSLSLKNEIDALERMCAGQRWATSDALGIGGLLSDCSRLAQLNASGVDSPVLRLDALLEESLLSLATLLQQDPFRLPADYRLAFRELGLAIGLEGLDELRATLEQRLPDAASVRRPLEQLLTVQPLAATIEEFWLDPNHQRQPSWTDHLDINRVMLATSLAPERFLRI